MPPVGVRLGGPTGAFMLRGDALPGFMCMAVGAHERGGERVEERNVHNPHRQTPTLNKQTACVVTHEKKRGEIEDLDQPRAQAKMPKCGEITSSYCALVLMCSARILGS